MKGALALMLNGKLLSNNSPAKKGKKPRCMFFPAELPAQIVCLPWTISGMTDKSILNGAVHEVSSLANKR